MWGTLILHVSQRLYSSDSSPSTGINFLIHSACLHWIAEFMIYWIMVCSTACLVPLILAEVLVRRKALQTSMLLTCISDPVLQSRSRLGCSCSCRGSGRCRCCGWLWCCGERICGRACWGWGCGGQLYSWCRYRRCLISLAACVPCRNIDTITLWSSMWHTWKHH